MPHHRRTSGPTAAAQVQWCQHNRCVGASLAKKKKPAVPISTTTTTTTVRSVARVSVVVGGVGAGGACQWPGGGVGGGGGGGGKIAQNAVTPKSSPLPTPKHRKGVVEVIIPPNINDPLNLLGEEEEDDYEKSLLLISPVKGGGGGGLGAAVGGKKNKRKRRHTKSFSQAGGEEAGVAVGGGGSAESRLHEADKPEQGSDCTSDAAMEAASLTRRKARANLKPLDLDGSGRDEIEMAVNEVTSPDKDVGSTDAPHTPTNPTAETTTAAETLTVTSSTLAAATTTNSPTATKSAATTNLSGVVGTKPVSTGVVGAKPVATGVGGAKPVTPSSAGGGIFKKCRKDSKDKIVSPAIPQPGAWGDKSHHHHHHRFRPHQLTPHIDKNQKTPNFKEVNTRFRYGNYNRYYGYRNPSHSQQQQQQQQLDPRLRVLLRRRDLFEGRDVLDIGCNVGHVTLAVARDTNPRSIVGIDIDR
ncbi:hypothetical protein LSTR_LSTR014311 [Laodelphax striatellus]|uniref:RNA methyltransferase n=1 Tax=Laodelphax striatellus TaxID=195883 RepID=A0A482X0J5_LAOST|nr:hypothetical protein LSTR_LSTR014311 [Laodelphax striatellus]